MSAWSWLKLRVFLWLLRTAIRVATWLLLLAVLAAAWPVTLVAVIGLAVTWRRGWPAVRLYRTAAWALPITGVWLIITQARKPGWRSAALAAGQGWTRGLHQLGGTGLIHTFYLLLPVALPAGLGLAGLAWAWRTYALAAGIGGWTASAPAIFDRRQWKRQVRTAVALNKAPGAVPLLTRGRRIPVGATIRTVGHAWHPVFSLSAAECGRHMVLVGATGSGKTNLMIRLWAGWFTAALQTARAGRGNPPLLIVLDCKGGRDARTKAERTRRLIYGAGARRFAIWPDEARLCLWELPAEDLAVLLYQMIDTGTGAAAYYADILQAVVDLAVLAPSGPPASTAAFLDRLEAKWLQHAWGDGRHPAELSRARAAGRHLPDIQLRYATLLGRLGPALDGPGTLADADAWYCILEGTREPSVAEAQAMALIELAARAATDPDGQPRVILLAADDYSAVAGRVSVSNLYERGRSLGIGVQVSAQTWQGLGRDDDERYRIAATADGGVFVLRTPYPEPLTLLAGYRRVLETAHKLVGNVWADEGTTRTARAATADPDLIRQLAVGQACYIQGGGATFVQVARPKASPLTLPAPAAQPSVQVPEPRREPDPAPPAWPQRPASLNDVFGPGGPR